MGYFTMCIDHHLSPNPFNFIPVNRRDYVENDNTAKILDNTINVSCLRYNKIFGDCIAHNRDRATFSRAPVPRSAAGFHLPPRNFSQFFHFVFLSFFNRSEYCHCRSVAVVAEFAWNRIKHH